MWDYIRSHPAVLAILLVPFLRPIARLLVRWIAVALLPLFPRAWRDALYRKR